MKNIKFMAFALVLALFDVVCAMEAQQGIATAPQTQTPRKFVARQRERILAGGRAVSGFFKNGWGRFQVWMQKVKAAVHARAVSAKEAVGRAASAMRSFGAPKPAVKEPVEIEMKELGTRVRDIVAKLKPFKNDPKLSLKSISLAKLTAAKNWSILIDDCIYKFEFNENVCVITIEKLQPNSVPEVFTVRSKYVQDLAESVLMEIDSSGLSQTSAQ